ncbi:MAG: efflux RND transporter permease subunit, partial [Planctomycetota bacterium]
REVHVLADPVALAQRGLNHLDVVAALRGENANVSAGTIAEGKRDIRVRLLGQYTETHQIEDTVIAYREGNPVYVRDVATVELSHEKRRGFVRSLGQPAIAMNVIRQSGANVVDLMAELRARLDEVRAGVLPNLGDGAVGPDLRMRQVYDETEYIDSAIRLVTQNIFIGGAIAGVVLMVFLRSAISTSIIALALPISVIGTFLVLLALGRTLNVISLAGLAFAVGMVVDNAIVVLENIYRRLQNGENPLGAAYRGGREVWGAILASTLTTAAVFIPVLTIQEEAGQLFRDISLAIVAAVVLSLVVSITVIPAACSRWLHAESKNGKGNTSPTKKPGPLATLFGLDAVFSALVQGLASSMRWLMGGWRGYTLRPAIIIAMTAASLGGAIVLIPPLDYLPAGNRNLVFGGLLVPPGLSVERAEEIATTIETQVLDYAGADINDPASMAALAPIPRWGAPGEEVRPFDPVAIDNIFVASFGGGMFGGASSQDDNIVLPLGTLLSNAFNNVNSDIFGGARQTSLFAGVGSGGNSVNVEISGPDLERVTSAAGMMYGLGGQRYGFGQGITADPGNFDLAQPEIQ